MSLQGKCTLFSLLIMQFDLELWASANLSKKINMSIIPHFKGEMVCEISVGVLQMSSMCLNKERRMLQTILRRSGFQYNCI